MASDPAIMEAAIVADKLRAYGVGGDDDDDAEVATGGGDDEAAAAADAQSRLLWTPTSGTRSVYFIDEATGVVSRPGTAGNDGIRLPSRPHDSAARQLQPTTSSSTPSPRPSPRAGILRPPLQGTPSPRPSSRGGILRPPSQGRAPSSSGGRPRSSGSGREHAQAADRMVPRPPPKRPASSGSRPLSRDRALPSDAQSTTTPDLEGRPIDSFARAAAVPELQPMAGFGVDVSVVQEVDEDVQSPGSTIQAGPESSLAGGDSSLAGGDSILVFDDDNMGEANGSQPTSVVIGADAPGGGDQGDADDEEDLSPEPAVIAERKLMRVLRFVRWFKEMGMNELRDVARSGLAIFYPAGSTVVQQQDEGDSMFVVIQGTVQMETELGKGATARAQKNQVQTLGEGQTFGESAVVWVEPDEPDDDDDELWDEDKWWRSEAASDGFDYTAREWTVTAVTDCIVLELPRRRLRPLLDDRPALVRALRIHYEQARAATAIQRGYR